MTEPLTITELDERTKDELRPECCMATLGVPCGAPAKWVVFDARDMGRHVWPALFVCGGCLTSFVAGSQFNCDRCGKVDIKFERIEPLR